MIDMNQYQIRSWFESGMLKPMQERTETTKVRVSKRVKVLAAGAFAMASVVSFTGTPSSVVFGQWAPAHSIPKASDATVTAHIQASFESIERSVANFNSPDVSPAEAELLELARLALLAVGARTSPRV